MNHPFLAIGPLGTTEMIIIAVLILVLFGAKKLPSFARSLGKSMGEFKKAREEFEHELTTAQDEAARPVTKAPEQQRIPTTTDA
ncbi:twin-arginine translocase TatA/TatE family subunit [Phragmitibacter flavus]|uniref:Sec-independent protein translocase protein TatA n=1 Tax=Phragmitibacter flavus TaxID=2576071 RepID=A0A5R8KEI4_9BACT|nr:twin-arginine translocase TatA/TatE family subunit [Phragmitibacter flavus]TLD70718.1 twin-arginine translocase TatA/TatE family subunit [Phragmitibacter flavus]